MNIAILTRGRVGRIRTLESIPRNWVDRTFIVCPEDEVAGHRAAHPGLRVIAESEGEALDFSEKNHRLTNGAYPELGRKILTIDDDIRFSMREGQSTILAATEQAVDAGFQQLESMLDTYPLVGLYARANGNRMHPGLRECARINAIRGLNLDLIGPVVINQYPLQADMRLNLTLLSRGQKTAVWCNLLWDQVGASNAKGGCSLYRTEEMQAEASRGLHAMFPHCVRLKEKEVKKGWFGGTRVDFVVQWRKAYEYSQRS